MQIHRIYTHSSLRNFTYILVDESEENAYCIDPYDASQVIDFLRPRGLKLHAIINTHEHWDHTRGNAQLVEEYGAKIYVSEGARNKIPGADFFLQSGDVFSFPDNIDVRVLETPGHTAAHICLLLL
ncbi:MAG: MBL fold metallo-hydrolase [Spirochaetota bacterium]